jgi:hypothetical protein
MKIYKGVNENNNLWTTNQKVIEKERITLLIARMSICFFYKPEYEMMILTNYKQNGSIMW